MSADPVLFDVAAPRPGPVEAAARAAVTDRDTPADVFLVAHLITVAAALDRCAGRVDPRGMTMLSRELREVSASLGLSKPAAPRGGDPFGFLAAIPDDPDAGVGA